MNHEITVYTLPNCRHCKEVKRYLIQKGLSFREIDIKEDEQAAYDVLRMTGSSGVPVIAVNNIVIVGDDHRKLDAVLG